mgnify:CR=1 FL=1
MSTHGAAGPSGVFEDPKVTIVLPCLNEAESIVPCIEEAQEGLRRAGLAGEVLVVATRQQGNPHVPGVDVGATSLLITLNFRATAASAGNAFAFTATEVQTCLDPPGDTCAALGGVNYSGGTMTAN